MNIFVLDQNPALAAQYHYDKHVVKMCLEYAQILSTVHHIYNSDKAALVYKPTHINHPSVKWAAENCGNYYWLFYLWNALLEEFEHRFNKPHASARLCFLLVTAPLRLPYIYKTPQPSVTGNKIYSADPVENYRFYYVEDKLPLLKYTNRSVPAWIPQYLTNSLSH